VSAPGHRILVAALTQVDVWFWRLEVRMKLKIIAAFGALLLMPLIGFAQGNPAVTAKIPFAFMVEGRTLPAGPYEFQLMGEDLTTMKVVDTQTGHGVMVPIIAPDGLQSNVNAEVVFEKTGKTPYLSQVYIPGMDGYLLADQGGGSQLHLRAKAMK
jgi:hypothetical protein